MDRKFLMHGSMITELQLQSNRKSRQGSAVEYLVAQVMVYYLHSNCPGIVTERNPWSGRREIEAI